MSKGIREAFVPRQGHVFIQADYEGLELHTLAQCCIKIVGYSKLGDALNSGRDPHSEVASSLLNIPYAEVKARAKAKEPVASNGRQAGKVANFGIPVGLGGKSLISYARKNYGVILHPNPDEALKKAYNLIDTWKSTWTEMQGFFDHVTELTSKEVVGRRDDGRPITGGTIEQLFVKRFRGRSHYTSACSSFSQGLGADIAKNAMWLVSKACYVERQSPLFGCRPVAFVHDEIIAECKNDGRVHEAAQELGQLMLVASYPYLPDVPAKVEPLAMYYWSKDAVPVYDDRKRLLVWGN